MNIYEAYYDINIKLDKLLFKRPKYFPTLNTLIIFTSIIYVQASILFISNYLRGFIKIPALLNQSTTILSKSII